MRILYIAYSCSPYHGSEDAIGWNIPVESARENMVYVITKEEQRAYIEDYAKHNETKNIQFSYVDIPGIYKRLFTGPFYSGRLNIWHKRAEKLVRKICQMEKIDLIHQITPVEFRSVGNYGKIPDVKFVCGPLGGGEYIPRELRAYATNQRLLEFLRRSLNVFYKCTDKIRGTLAACDWILYANRETMTYLGENSEELLYTEIGIASSAVETNPGMVHSGKCRFLVSGRMVYRKGHSLLLDALDRLPAELAWECLIVGDGPEEERLRDRCRTGLLAERVSFLGRVSYAQMGELYKKADVLVVPSLRETTGTVILEAMAKGLPVITINKYGAATFVSNDCGWLYHGKSKEDYIVNLKNAVTDCIKRPDEVKRRGENARKVATNCVWEKKHAYYQHIYQRLLKM